MKYVYIVFLLVFLASCGQANVDTSGTGSTAGQGQVAVQDDDDTTTGAS